MLPSFLQFPRSRANSSTSARTTTDTHARRRSARRSPTAALQQSGYANACFHVGHICTPWVGAHAVRMGGIAADPNLIYIPVDRQVVRSLGRLLRRKKTQENLDAVLESFVPLPPKMSHADVADEAAPRSSMSSSEAFDVVDPAEPASSLGQTRTTIRKTLSPALLSDSPHQGIDEALEDEWPARSAMALLEPDLTSMQKVGRAAKQQLRRRHRKPTMLLKSSASCLVIRSAFDRLWDASSAATHRAIVYRASKNSASAFRISQTPLNRRLARTRVIADIAEPAFLREHRSVRRSVSGNVRGQAIPPPTLELAGVGRVDSETPVWTLSATGPLTRPLPRGRPRLNRQPRSAQRLRVLRPQAGRR